MNAERRTLFPGQVRRASCNCGKVRAAPFEVVQADLQNKVDVGLAIARRWIDEEKVDAIVGLGNSAVALAVQDLKSPMPCWSANTPDMSSSTPIFTTPSEIVPAHTPRGRIRAAAESALPPATNTLRFMVVPRL
jgi:hypothetical protein